MTLLTDGLAQAVLQLPRVDDRVVRAGGHVGLAMPSHMQLAGAVAALAADAVALEDRLAVVVDRVGHVIHAVGVAEQTVRSDGPIEVGILLVVPR